MLQANRGQHAKRNASIEIQMHFGELPPLKQSQRTAYLHRCGDDVIFHRDIFYWTDNSLYWMSTAIPLPFAIDSQWNRCYRSANIQFERKKKHVMSNRFHSVTFIVVITCWQRGFATRHMHYEAAAAEKSIAALDIHINKMQQQEKKDFRAQWRCWTR